MTSLALTTGPACSGEIGAALRRWAAGTPRLSGRVRNQSSARRAHTQAGARVVEEGP